MLGGRFGCLYAERVLGHNLWPSFLYFSVFTQQKEGEKNPQKSKQTTRHILKQDATACRAPPGSGCCFFQTFLPPSSFLTSLLYKPVTCRSRYCRRKCETGFCLSVCFVSFRYVHEQREQTTSMEYYKKPGTTISTRFFCAAGAEKLISPSDAR